MDSKIARIINVLFRKHKIRSPFVIAKNLGILVFFEDLGTINGYYNKVLRMKQIHINQNCSNETFICAHELGHAVLHPDSNTTFLINSTYMSISKIEKEANMFAMELLIPDEVILENHHLTAEQFSRLLGYDQALIEMRLDSYRKI